MNLVICHHCDNYMIPLDHFCTSCGKDLRKSRNEGLIPIELWEKRSTPHPPHQKKKEVNIRNEIIWVIISVLVLILLLCFLPFKQN